MVTYQNSEVKWVDPTGCVIEDYVDVQAQVAFYSQAVVQGSILCGGKSSWIMTLDFVYVLLVGFPWMVEFFCID